MGWRTAIGIGANLLGGITGAIGAGGAARRQEQRAREANDLLRSTQQANYGDLSPYRDLGAGATGRMAALLGVGGDRNDPRFGELTRRFSMADYEEDPGMQFRRDQGEQSINRNALARGRFNSGSALKELQTFNSGLASQEFGNAFDRWRAESGDIYGRLGDASGRGQRAVESGNADRSNLNSLIAGNTIGIGNAQGASRIAQGNALARGLEGAADWWSGSNVLGNNMDGTGIDRRGRRIF
jgi:hypothetical protein